MNNQRPVFPLLKGHFMQYLYKFISLSIIALAALPRPALAANSAPTPDVVTIDDSAPAHPLNHFWEEMFGSGRAILALRDSYRDDLRSAKQVTGFRYVRFHAIFQDEIGLYDETAQGNSGL